MPAPARTRSVRAPLARQAAIACNSQMFRTFLVRAKGCSEAATIDGAATAVRVLCGVTSRADFDRHTDAGVAWRDLWAEYQGWRNPR
ncbi:hypothetical protein [Microbaculum marinisediminis]|uniref:Uncharacterized protein n=1 Tax=Microbaculum marinisediminis TaxID=2931392 RepID=A0AAW5QSI6_9HYPH|nr:hypothetical protein [Microbaculum sp. A6E488]MCT8970623.1 hypothetical protein [Microbaculum sp. A6E488]